jgi:uncharacterized protein (TIGR02117 family)
MPWARPRRGLAPLLLALPCLWLAACSAAVHGPRPPGTAPRESVYVVSNGWHTGVVLPGQPLASGRGIEGLDVGRYRYLEVGWGDRDAYLADHITLGLALKAAFGSRGSVLLVTGFDETIPERYRGIDVVELRLSGEALGSLARFVEASLAGDAAGRLVRLQPGWSPSTTFYLARGRFHLLNTCNAWTARALRAAGLPLTPALTLTAYHLMEQVVPLGRRVVARPA